MSRPSATAVRTIAGLVDAAAARNPLKKAVVSPFQGHAFTYEQLCRKSNALANFLRKYGYTSKDLLVSDLPNTTENLLSQLACNRLGVAYATAKDLEGMAKFPKVKGAIVADADSVKGGCLSETNLPLPYLSGDYLLDLIHGGGLDEYDDDDVQAAQAGNADLASQPPPHAFYNSTTPFTNKEALELGDQVAVRLGMSEDDTVCVSITLCHAFGIGSAACSALTAGATIMLPAVGGIRGCGVPSERAQATFDVLKRENCTLLFADTHTLKALPDANDTTLPSLRGGVCKIGSGSDFLDGETRTYAGAELFTMGKKK